MATTEQFLSGTGATPLGFTTEYINESDIKVRVDGGSPLTFIGTTGTPTTGQYKIAANSTTITFGDNQNGKSLHIYSETDVTSPTVTFTPGSSIKAADLNALETLVRHGIQESRNDIIEQDLRDGQVTSAKILDGTIVNADINASADIANSKIADGLLKSSITVNSANIVDGSIVDADVSNSANINGSKLLVDSVTLAKLGSGTLPSDIVVTSTNIEDGTIVNADINTSANDGTIHFYSTINSEGSETNALTLKAKGGTIKINGIIGGSQNIGALKINDDDANGTGKITLNGVGGDTNTVGITGTVDIGHTGTTGIDLAGSYYNINGATVFTTADTADIIDIKAAQTIKTSNDDVSFVQGTIALDDDANLTIDAGTGTVTLTTIGAVHDEVIDITGVTINACIIGNG